MPQSSSKYLQHIVRRLSDLREDLQTLMSAFAYFLAIITKVLLPERRLGASLYLLLKFMFYFNFLRS